MRGWHGNGYKHSLASKGIRSYDIFIRTGQMGGKFRQMMIDIANEFGAGIYPIYINGERYAIHIESWGYFCVEADCGHIEDPEEFDKCAFDIANHYTFSVIPKEYEDAGYEVIYKSLENLGDEPYGTSIILLKPKKEIQEQMDRWFNE